MDYEEVDGFREECGIFGVFNHTEAANLAYLGLYGLQHRGQESAGIVASPNGKLKLIKGMGLVAEVFNRKAIEQLPGTAAIGHNRYSTAGTSTLENAQPILVSTHRGQIAVAHNGNLVNAYKIRKELESEGSIFLSTSDSEVILHLIARSRQKALEDAIFDALTLIRGAYSLLFLTTDRLIAFRDSHGFRPLSLGRLHDAWVLASETCAFDLIGAEFIRDVAPGEMIVISKDGLCSYRPFKPQKYSFCIFEHVYFARPDSVVFGRSVTQSRNEMGANLAKEWPVDADIVVPVPDSGFCAAIGYSRASGIPFDQGLIRNHYVGRTFIEPKTSIRHFGVKIKLNPVKSLVKGKRIVLIEDSIVRGTTCMKVVEMLKNAGAREVHMRISSPPTIGPCYYGIDTPLKEELIANRMTVKEIKDFIGADTIGYLSQEGLMSSLGEDGLKQYCTACFSGQYPVEFPREDLLQMDLFEKARQ
jgi:amidophosphoribosyltransferase